MKNIMFKLQKIRNFRLLAIITTCFSIGLMAQDTNNQQGPLDEYDGLTAVDINNVTTQVTSICHNTVDGIKKVSEVVTAEVTSMYKDVLVPVWRKIGSNTVEVIKSAPETLNNGIDYVGVQVLNLKDAVSNKIDKIYSKYEAQKIAQNLDTQEIISVKKGNSLYFNTLEIFNLNSDDAKIEMAKVELGPDKVVAIEAFSMGVDKANQTFLKAYNKKHPAVFTDVQKMTGVGLFVTTVAGFIAYKYFYGSDIDSTEEIDKN